MVRCLSTTPADDYLGDFTLTAYRHAWMSYMVDKSPAVDPLLQRQVRVWEPKEHRPTLTWSRSGYKPYSTYVFTTSPITQQMDSNHSHSTKNKYSAWTPVAKARA